MRETIRSSLTAAVVALVVSGTVGALAWKVGPQGGEGGPVSHSKLPRYFHFVEMVVNGTAINVPRGNFTSYSSEYNLGDRVRWDPNTGQVDAPERLDIQPEERIFYVRTHLNTGFANITRNEVIRFPYPNLAQLEDYGLELVFFEPHLEGHGVRGYLPGGLIFEGAGPLHDKDLGRGRTLNYSIIRTLDEPAYEKGNQTWRWIPVPLRLQVAITYVGFLERDKVTVDKVEGWGPQHFHSTV